MSARRSHKLFVNGVQIGNYGNMQDLMRAATAWGGYVSPDNGKPIDAASTRWDGKAKTLSLSTVDRHW